MTLGEVGRNLADVKASLRGLEQKVDALSGVYVRVSEQKLVDDAQNVRIADNAAKIEDIEERLTTNFRIALTGVLLPLLVLLASALILANLK